MTITILSSTSLANTEVSRHENSPPQHPAKKHQPPRIPLRRPLQLLLDDVRSLIHPFSLLTLIAGGSHRLSEVGARLQKPTAELSRPLRRLIDLGYVVKEQPYGAPPRSGKQTYHRVAGGA
jgi:hypothetical protein